MTLETDEVVILEFGQGLWFGNCIKHSLINTNQICYYCVNICDDLTNKYRTLGVEKEPFSSPMKMDGTTCGFISRYPTYDELETCRHVRLSDVNFLDPSNDLFEIL